MAGSKVHIPPHTHCRVCGKSIPLGRDYCSSECRDRDLKAQSRSKRITRIYTLIFVLLLVMFLLFSFIGGRR